MITGKNYIGNLRASSGTKTFKTFNPLKNVENKTVFFEASTIEIEHAIDLATKAFEQFQLTSGIDKSIFLFEIANEIIKLDEELIDTYCSESGLSKERAIAERERTLFQLQTFAKLVKDGSWVEASIDTAKPSRVPIPKSDIRKLLTPIGPIVVFGASNFPLAYSTAGGDTASALAAGCPVIVKSHPMHTGTGELVASAIINAAEKTGMPNGVFSNLNSSGNEVGEFLVKHTAIKAVGFTGSLNGGRALYNLASKRNEPIPVFAEMGSVNPVILFPNAVENNYKHWAKTYSQSITNGAGQFCTNPGLIFGIKSESLSKFINVLIEEVKKIAPTCMLHPKIFEAFNKNKNNVLKNKNVAVSFENKGIISDNFGKHTIATINGKAFLKNPNLHQEVFGPFSMIVQCEDLHELENCISNLEGQLTGTILASNNEQENYTNLINLLKQRVGRLIFNGVPTGVEVCDSMVHGGPYPATTDSRFTAVGAHSIKRWVRSVCYQNWPNNLLPNELKNENPLNILRIIDGEYSKKSIQ
ncbi:aldehyde dehydrogenase (NADP(+)) [uncultured Lutibacter sp.]|uniref:aldehyde dehydrogenase (NADP(+)) n=1 Tax=uncultured Lutibacter sp. TaxID=437739 RepID=UPI0026390AF5|nr:aldehyde dehydrogenase (NADP(+)) [uncultured Lutibacter sp.]